MSPEGYYTYNLYFFAFTWVKKLNLYFYLSKDLCTTATPGDGLTPSVTSFIDYTASVLLATHEWSAYFVCSV